MCSASEKVFNSAKYEFFTTIQIKKWPLKVLISFHGLSLYTGLEVPRLKAVKMFLAVKLMKHDLCELPSSFSRNIQAVSWPNDRCWLVANHFPGRRSGATGVPLEHLWLERLALDWILCLWEAIQYGRHHGPKCGISHRMEGGLNSVIKKTGSLIKWKREECIQVVLWVLEKHGRTAL